MVKLNRTLLAITVICIAYILSAYGDEKTSTPQLKAKQRPHLLIDFTDTQQLKDVDKGNRNLKDIFRGFRLERLDQLISEMET